MTRNLTIIFVLFCLFLSAGFYSCKKTKIPSGTAAKLEGKWLKVRYATDDNANGLLDSWEEHSVEPGTTNTIEFKSDSTGIETDKNSQDIAFRWMLNGELSLMIIYHTGDTVVSKITFINGAHLDLSSKAKFGLVGYYYDIQK